MSPIGDKSQQIGAALRMALALLEGKPPSSMRSYIPHSPTLRQRLFLELPHGEAFFGGAAGGGKSESLLMAALEHVETPGYAALILRRTFQDLAKPGALLDRAHQWLSQTSARWNEQRKQWRFPNGAVLSFGYLENDNDVYQYQSAEYQFIGFDELTQFTERQYTYLFSRLRRLASADVPLRMRSASNPGGVGAEWVQARFIPDDWVPEMGREMRLWEKNGRAFVPAKLADNPHLDQESYRQSLAELDEVTRAQLLDGDWQVRHRGNIYKEWSDGPDGYHVITWSEFERIYGQRSIPSHWLGACGQDWGFDPDPCATVWNFTAGENGPLAGAIFVPAILTCRGMIPDDVGELVKLVEAREGWASRIQYRVMSHEASSQRATYAAMNQLYFQKCKPDAHGGIAQMQHYLRIVNTDKPNPFRPWLKGHPRYFLVVPDDQITNPKDDRGLTLLRAEFSVYRYTDERVTPHLGAASIKPYDHFNHFMDAQRYVAARWFAQVKPLTERERFDQSLPEELRSHNIPSPETDGGWALTNWDWSRAIAKEQAKRRKRMSGESSGREHWSHEICSPDNPWDQRSPFENSDDNPWRE